MPNYTYRCESCGNEREELRRIADADILVSCEAGCEGFTMKRVWKAEAPSTRMKITGVRPGEKQRGDRVDIRESVKLERDIAYGTIRAKEDIEAAKKEIKTRTEVI